MLDDNIQQRVKVNKLSSRVLGQSALNISKAVTAFCKGAAKSTAEGLAAVSTEFKERIAKGAGAEAAGTPLGAVGANVSYGSQNGSKRSTKQGTIENQIFDKSMERKLNGS